MFFFFKQKTAYEMRISDWSSDVCSSDLAEGRGFCAGGDIRLLADSAKTDCVEAEGFYFHEYRMNHLLFVYEKPIVAFIDGITMGGGVGISLPARYRIATERTTFAMRSEEHTSELQSLMRISYAVFCLKKKNH